jgi:hypothetical protein
MTIVNFQTPAFTRRDPDMICWRVAAIHRCCLKLGMPKSWAVEKLREICPKGHRDHMADIWFSNIDEVRGYLQRKTEATQSSSQEFAKAA